MTDKELIKQGIERRMNNLWYLIPEGEKVLKDDFTKDDANNLGKYTALESLLQFIDSLPEEPISEDLDYLVISLEETIGTSPHSREVIKEHLQKAAEWQKQQMMKDAVEGEYWIGEIHLDTPIIQGYDDGDRIKFIPIKYE